MKTILLIVLVGFYLVACGKVSLVTDQVKPGPAPVEVPAVRTMEVFSYGVPSGVLVVPILFLSSKTMVPWAEKFSQSRDMLAAALCDTPWNFSNIDLSIATDSGSWENTVNQGRFSPSDPGCRYKVADFVARAMETVKIAMRGDFLAKPYPLESLSDAIAAVSAAGFPPSVPAWVRWIYLRDQEMILHTGWEKNPVGLSRLHQSVSALPLSPFRKGLTSFSFIDSTSDCAPPKSRVAPLLRRYLASVDGAESLELCDLGPEVLRAVIARVAEQSGHMVLGMPVKANSLQVKLEGAVLPREKFHFEDRTQEIKISDRAAPKRGDRVEVSYETK